jgi:hypothetical protein
MTCVAAGLGAYTYLALLAAFVVGFVCFWGVILYKAARNK